MHEYIGNYYRSWPVLNQGAVAELLSLGILGASRSGKTLYLCMSERRIMSKIATVFSPLALHISFFCVATRSLMTCQESNMTLFVPL